MATLRGLQAEGTSPPLNGVTGNRLQTRDPGGWIQDHYVNGPAFGGAIGTAAGFCKFARHLLESSNFGFSCSENTNYAQKEGGGAGFHCSCGSTGAASVPAS